MTSTAAFCSNRQVLGPEARVVAENLLQALRFFGHARVSSEIIDLPGVSLVFCGLNYAAFNAALLSQPVEEKHHELSRLVEIASKKFDARDLRWTYWVCDDFLHPATLHETDRIFSRHGLRPLTEAPGMYTEKLFPPDRQLPVLDVRPVADAATRNAFAKIMSLTFEIPQSICDAIYGSERAWMSNFHGYVGFADGQAVASAAATITGDAIGLYSVATLPSHRRRGYAEAIMRQVIANAERSAGVKRTVLQSTRSGYSLYKKMGYRAVTNFNVYIAD